MAQMKGLRKELVEAMWQGIINAADEQVLRKRTKVNFESRTRNDKTQDEIQQHHVEAGKVDCEITVRMKERERILQRRARHFH